MGSFYVFKNIVEEMNLNEVLLTNGDLNFVRILHTELIPSKEIEGIYVYKIVFKRIDRRTLNQLVIDRVIEEVRKTNPENAEKMERENKIPSKLKKKKIKEVSEELYNISPNFSTQFAFYYGQDFLLVPKFNGKLILEEEYLEKFPEIEELYLDSLIKKDVFKLGKISKQVIENSLEIMIFNSVLKGVVKEGVVLKDNNKSRVKLNPFIVSGKLEEAVEIVKPIIKLLQERNKK